MAGPAPRATIAYMAAGACLLWACLVVGCTLVNTWVAPNWR
jgi:hypothetical protein